MATEEGLKEFEEVFHFRPDTDAARIEIITDRKRVFYFILMAIDACETTEKENPEQYEWFFNLAVRMWNLAGKFDRQPSFQD